MSELLWLSKLLLGLSKLLLRLSKLLLLLRLSKLLLLLLRLNKLLLLRLCELLLLWLVGYHTKGACTLVAENGVVLLLCAAIRTKFQNDHSFRFFLFNNITVSV